jgi:hypothetical protein
MIIDERGKIRRCGSTAERRTGICDKRLGLRGFAEDCRGSGERSEQRRVERGLSRAGTARPKTYNRPEADRGTHVGMRSHSRHRLTYTTLLREIKHSAAGGGAEGSSDVRDQEDQR